MTASTPDFLDALFHPKGTPEQQACSHLLSAEMPDGKHFCPSCRLVSSWPLVKS